VCGGSSRRAPCWTPRWSASTSRSSAPAATKPDTCSRCRAPARHWTYWNETSRRCAPSWTPLALEPIAALFDWPEDELTEADWLTELMERTDTWLLLDVANVYANARNRGTEPTELLDRLPLERVAYVHVAGGAVDETGLYHDTHTAATPQPVLELIGELAARLAGGALPPLLLERDGHSRRRRSCTSSSTPSHGPAGWLRSPVRRGRSRHGEQLHTGSATGRTGRRAGRGWTPAGRLRPAAGGGGRAGIAGQKGRRGGSSLAAARSGASRGLAGVFPQVGVWPAA
jgi:hypothetical protein